MKEKNIKNSHYLSISYKILINSKIVLFFIFLLDILSIFLQLIEIYYNEYQLNDIKKIINFSPLTKFLIIINTLPILIKFIIYVIIILTILIISYIFNNYRFKKNLFIIIILNCSELLFYRVFSLFIFNYLFTFEDIYLIVNIIITIPYILMLYFNFHYNHLYFFFPSFISYPFDSFSMIIDLHFLFMKIFLSISTNNSNERINKLCFFLAIFTFFILLLYLSYIMINKSYYLMNNCLLNKSRFSILLSFFFILIFILVNGRSEILNIYFIACYINIFLICLFIINYFYVPYQFSKFDKDDNIENIFYYFFILDRDKNKYLLIEEKIEQHISKCNRCNLCKKYNKIKNKNLQELDFYKIISNNKNHLYNLVNKILRSIKINGKKSLANNSYFLINIIYVYCISINQNDYNLILNSELLFEIINSENQFFLEDYKASLNNIRFTNDFFIKANKILQIINEIFEEKKANTKLEKVFILAENLQNFKYKENKSNINNVNNANYNGSNIQGLPNCHNLLTISSLFYEELYNEPISNSGILIRDSPNILEELNNQNYKNSKQITLQINIQSFNVKIIRAGGQMCKYENNNFFDFFPSLFKNNQINYMKNILLHSNENLKINTKQNNKKIKKKTSEKQYINLLFVIEEKEDNEIYYKLLKLKLSLIFLTHINNKIYLNGIYMIDDNIILTEQKKDEEIILHFGKKELIGNNIKNKNKNNIISKNKNKKFYNGKIIAKDHSFYVGCKKYNIYHILSSKRASNTNKSNSFKRTLININRLEEQNSSSNSMENKIYIFNDLSSQTSSTESIMTKNALNYNKSNKNIKNHDQITSQYKYIGYVLIYSFIGLFAFIIIQFIVLNYYRNDFHQIIRFYFLFKDYSIIYNHLFFSILSLACTANSPNSFDCRNNIKIMSNILVNNTDISDELITSFYIDFSQIFFEANEVLVEMINNRLNRLANYLSKEQSNINYFNAYKTHYLINQILSENKIILSIKEENITFTDFILLVTSRFSILTKDIKDYNKPIYILNKTGTETFNNVLIKDNEKLTSFQENVYLMILDCKSFIEQIDFMINEIAMRMVVVQVRIQRLLYIFIYLSLIFVIIIIILLIIYILIYYFLIFKILKYIFYSLKETIGETTVKDIIKKKLDNLKLLILFYENDINKTIDELNRIYDEYKYNCNAKLKEESKLYKRQGTKEISNIANTKKENFIKSIKKLKKYQIIKYSKRKKIYLYSLYLIILMTIIIYIIINVIWSIYYQKGDIMTKWIPLTSDISIYTDKLMITFLLMIYNNQTLEEISMNYETNDYISYIYKKLTNLYEAEKYIDSISTITKLNNINEDYNCSTFYESINNEFFDNLQIKFKDRQEQLNNTIIKFCESSNIMEFKNYKTIYLQIFNSIKIGMENYNNKQYSDIINFMDKYEIYKIEILYLLTYVFLLDILNQNVESAMMLMSDKMRDNIIITMIILIILLIFFIFFTFFIYLRNVNNDSQRFIQIKNILKVCNINE